MSDDVRISEWNLDASAGMTTRLQFTAPTALTSLSVYTGGTVDDVDDLTDADEHAGTLSGLDLIATVDLVVPPVSGPEPLRLVVNGAVQSVGLLYRSTQGNPVPDNTITLTAAQVDYDLEILGVIVEETGGGGGAPTDATYLTTTSNATLSAEVVVGATPGGELGGTWGSPTVDALHGGSTHAAVQSAAEATAAADATSKADAKVTQTITNGVTTTAPSEDAVFDALALKAALASPALTGNPTAPTQSAADNSTKIATTAYADAKVADAINDSTTGVAPSQNAVFDALALKAPLASPTLTGTPAAPTAAQGTNTTQVATTAYVQTEVGLLVPKSLWDANTMLYATTDNTPVALTIAASRVVGRKASGDIAAMTGAETAAVLAGEVFKQAQEFNAQTGTTYTLVAGDAGKNVTLSNGSAITLTLPQDSDATIAIGTYVDLYQLGAGQVTVAAGTGATLRTSGLTAKARAQYSRFGVQKVSANTWSLFGDLAAS